MIVVVIIVFLFSFDSYLILISGSISFVRSETWIKFLWPFLAAEKLFGNSLENRVFVCCFRKLKDRSSYRENHNLKSLLFCITFS